MKLNLIILIILLVGCNINNFENVNVSSSAQKSSVTETDTASEILKSRPQWLFPADNCPIDVFPAKEKKIEFLSERCSVSLQACLDKCRANDGNSCYSLALFFQENFEVKSEFTEALFLRSCKLGIISGCTNKAAAMYSLDSKDSAKIKCAADTFEKTCSLNDSWGCAMYGLALSSGVGRKKNTDEAMKFFSKSCQISGEDDEACKQARDFQGRMNDRIEK